MPFPSSGEGFFFVTTVEEAKLGKGRKFLIAVAAVAVLVVLAAFFAFKPASVPVDKASRMRSAARAAEWLRSQQQKDGSFGALTLTAEMVEAISSAGQDVRSPRWTPGSTSLYGALENQTLEYLKSGKRDAGVIAKIVIGVISAGGNPRNFAGYDLVQELKSTYNPDDGLYHETNLFRDSFALLALAESGEKAPKQAVDRVFREKRDRGCWGWQIGGKGCDTDTTAVTLLALAANGVPRNRVEDVFRFLRRREHRDAGWGSWDSQTESNTNSTAWALLALKAYGENPRADKWAKRRLLWKTNPLERLLKFQHQDGSFWYLDDQEGGRVLATCEALLAVTQDYPGDEK